jgi:hypothetical protein
MIRELAIAGCAIMFSGATIAIVIGIMMFRRAGSEENR